VGGEKTFSGEGVKREEKVHTHTHTRLQLKSQNNRARRGWREKICWGRSEVVDYPLLAGFDFEGGWG